MRRKSNHTAKVFRAGSVPKRQALHDRAQRLSEECAKAMKGRPVSEALLLTEAQTFLLEAARVLGRVQVAAEEEPCPICELPFLKGEATLEGPEGTLIHTACHGSPKG